jgi:putative transposase
MGSRGDCFDNAVAERLFATLKKELVDRNSWPTRRQLAGEVFEYVEAFYNRLRRHSTLGYLSPADYENRTLGQPVLASPLRGSRTHPT